MKDTDTGQRLLGLALRERRNTHKLTLREVAGRSGLSPDTLVSIENGRRLPSLGTLHALAQTYGTTARGLLAGVFPWDGGEPPAK